MDADKFYRDLIGTAKGEEKRLLRVDEIPYLFSLPMVYFLAKLKVHPNQVVLATFVCSMAGVYGLLRGWQINQALNLIVLMVLRVLLDCVDGQLARYRGVTSSLGALYDLGADFLFTVGFFMAAAYSVVVYENVLPLKAIYLSSGAFFSLVFTSTIASFFSRLSDRPLQSISEIKQQFVSVYVNDRPGNWWYTLKVTALNQFFNLSWRSISLLIFFCLIRGSDARNRKITAHITAVFEFGIHWIIFALLLLVSQSLITFLLYEIVAFCVSIVLVLLLVTTKSNAV